MRILLSRTDSIGDVVLTLPMAGVISKELPNAEVHFLGRSYTEAVVKCSGAVHSFHNWDEVETMDETSAVEEIRSWKIDAWIHVFPNRSIARLVKKSSVPVRIGTSGRLFHWSTCNKRVRFSRRRSQLHESQLNLKLLHALGIDVQVSLSKMPGFADFTHLPQLRPELGTLLKKDAFKVILHPKSKGSAVEWGLDNFQGLIGRLNSSPYQVIVTGTEADRKAIGDDLLLDQNNVLDLLGKLSLEDLIALIAHCDCLVAASTGPLHLAGILDKLAIGLFSPRRPIHPGRWSPLGQHSTALVHDENCKRCRAGKSCNCIEKISPEDILRSIETYRSLHPDLK